MWSLDKNESQTIFIVVGVVCALLVALLIAALYLLRIRQKKGAWIFLFLPQEFAPRLSFPQGKAMRKFSFFHKGPSDAGLAPSPSWNGGGSLSLLGPSLGLASWLQDSRPCSRPHSLRRMPPRWKAGRHQGVKRASQGNSICQEPWHPSASLLPVQVTCLAPKKEAGGREGSYQHLL